MNLTEIQNRITEAKDSPHMLADLRLELSAEFTARTEKLKAIERIKPRVWNAMRGSYKSDTATDKAWAATDEGMDENDLRRDLKALEKAMSAIKTMLEVMSGEARNQY